MTTASSSPSIDSTPSELEPQLQGRLARLAEARHRAPQSMVRNAVAQYVEREEKRHAFHEEAVAAWEEFQRTGLHVTAEEVDAWLAQLEAGEDVDPPVPHR